MRRARHAAPHRAGDGGAHHRVARRERPVHERRGPAGRAGHRRQDARGPRATRSRCDVRDLAAAACGRRRRVARGVGAVAAPDAGIAAVPWRGGLGARRVALVGALRRRARWPHRRRRRATARADAIGRGRPRRRRGRGRGIATSAALSAGPRAARPLAGRRRIAPGRRVVVERRSAPDRCVRRRGRSTASAPRSASTRRLVARRRSPRSAPCPSDRRWPSPVETARRRQLDSAIRGPRHALPAAERSAFGWPSRGDVAVVRAPPRVARAGRRRCAPASGRRRRASAARRRARARARRRRHVRGGAELDAAMKACSLLAPDRGVGGELRARRRLGLRRARPRRRAARCAGGGRRRRAGRLRGCSSHPSRASCARRAMAPSRCSRVLLGRTGRRHRGALRSPSPCCWSVDPWLARPGVRALRRRDGVAAAVRPAARRRARAADAARARPRARRCRSPRSSRAGRCWCSSTRRCRSTACSRTCSPRPRRRSRRSSGSPPASRALLPSVCVRARRVAWLPASWIAATAHDCRRASGRSGAVARGMAGRRCCSPRRTALAVAHRRRARRAAARALPRGAALLRRRGRGRRGRRRRRLGRWRAAGPPARLERARVRRRAGGCRAAALGGRDRARRHRTRSGAARRAASPASGSPHRPARADAFRPRPRRGSGCGRRPGRHGAPRSARRRREPTASLEPLVRRERSASSRCVAGHQRPPRRRALARAVAARQPGIPAGNDAQRRRRHPRRRDAGTLLLGDLSASPQGAAAHPAPSADVDS